MFSLACVFFSDFIYVLLRGCSGCFFCSAFFVFLIPLTCLEHDLGVVSNLFGGWRRGRWRGLEICTLACLHVTKCSSCFALWFRCLGFLLRVLCSLSLSSHQTRPSSPDPHQDNVAASMIANFFISCEYFKSYPRSSSRGAVGRSTLPSSLPRHRWSQHDCLFRLFPHAKILLAAFFTRYRWRPTLPHPHQNNDAASTTRTP